MKTPFVRIGFAAFFAFTATAVIWPQGASSQTGGTAAAESKSKAGQPAKKPAAGPFYGKLAALDKSAKTITVGKRTFRITSETKIRKDGKEAKLEDGVVGEVASGYVRPTDDGGWVASTVNFGPKPAKEETAKKK